MIAPAGWYADPEQQGQLRYWDGGAWTEHRTPVTSASLDSPSGGQEASVQGVAAGGATARAMPKSKGWIRRHPGWSVVVLLGVLIALIVPAGLVAALIAVPVPEDQNGVK